MKEEMRELKRKVTRDWLNEFPGLYPVSITKLHKIIGPIITGLELIRLPFSDEYRPHFVVYKLWEQELKDSLEWPILLFEFKNKKGLQFFIPFDKHDKYFLEAVESVKEQTIISFDHDVKLSSLFELINKQLNQNLVQIHPAKQAQLYEFMLLTALYVGSDKINYVLQRINKASTLWEMKVIEDCFGSFDIWFNNLKERIEHRDEFMNQILVNKQNKKLKKLKQSELIL